MRTFKIKLKHLAEAWRIRHQLRSGARRQAVLNLQHALQDHLAREVNVDIVAKHHRDHRQADFRERPDVGQARRAGQLQLQGKGDEALDLSRRQPRRFGHDLHKDGRHVRKGVDRNRAEGIDPSGRHDAGQGDNQHPLTQR